MVIPIINILIENSVSQKLSSVAIDSIYYRRMYDVEGN